MIGAASTLNIISLKDMIYGATPGSHFCSNSLRSLTKMESGGLEPPTFALQMRRSSQMNYDPGLK